MTRRPGPGKVLKTRANRAAATLPFSVTRMNAATWLVLGMIVLASGIVGFLMLTYGHNWGDDFAGYILQAQSIVQGRVSDYVQRNTFAVNASAAKFGPAIYPWGFPLLLAPVYAALGMNILAFKVLLTVCYMLFLIAFFLLARARCSNLDSLLLTAFMAFNLRLLHGQNEVLSDLPFLLWSTAGLWLVNLHANSGPGSSTRIGTGLLTGLVIFMAAWTRLNGVFLLVALAAAQLLARRGHDRLNAHTPANLGLVAIPYVVVALCFAAQALLLPSPPTGLLEQWRTFGIHTLLHNLWFYFVQPGVFLDQSRLGGYVLYAILLVFFAFTVAQRRARDVPLLVYVLATLVLFVSFPITQGVRYIYPILPVFFLFAFQGMKDAAQKLAPSTGRGPVALVNMFWAGLTVVSLGVSLLDARANLLRGRQDLDGPFSTGATPMFSYIREATPADSIIIFRKPRLMRLLTDREAFLTSQCADLPKGNFIVIAKEPDYDQIQLEQIEFCDAGVLLKRVFRKGDFVVYAIAPRPPG